MTKQNLIRLKKKISELISNGNGIIGTIELNERYDFFANEMDEINEFINSYKIWKNESMAFARKSLKVMDTDHNPSKDIRFKDIEGVTEFDIQNANIILNSLKSILKEIEFDLGDETMNVQLDADIERSKSNNLVSSRNPWASTTNLSQMWPVITEFNENQIFIIGPFRSPYNELYNYLIKPTIESYGLKPHRDDEAKLTEQFLPRILESIKRSRLVICDLSLVRPNVLFELGWTHAIGTPFKMFFMKGDQRPSDLSALNFPSFSFDEQGLKDLRKEITDVFDQEEIGTKPDRMKPGKYKLIIQAYKEEQNRLKERKLIEAEAVIIKNKEYFEKKLFSSNLDDIELLKTIGKQIKFVSAVVDFINIEYNPPTIDVNLMIHNQNDYSILFDWIEISILNNDGEKIAFLSNISPDSIGGREKNNIPFQFQTEFYHLKSMINNQYRGYKLYLKINFSSLKTKSNQKELSLNLRFQSNVISYLTSQI